MGAGEPNWHGPNGRGAANLSAQRPRKLHNCRAFWAWETCVKNPPCRAFGTQFRQGSDEFGNWPSTVGLDVSSGFQGFYFGLPAVLLQARMGPDATNRSVGTPSEKTYRNAGVPEGKDQLNNFCAI